MDHTYRTAAVWLLSAVTTIGAAQTQTPEPLDIRTGVYRGRSVTYEVINGLAVVEGDIILGTPEELAPPKGLQIIKGQDARKIGTIDPETRWPDSIVPYVTASDLPEPQRVLDAVQHWNDNTLIQLVERTNEPNWIYFAKGPGCRSNVGMVGGEQSIFLSDGCSVGTVIHEIGHAVGFFHEHQREDRDNHVNVLFDNIDKRRSFNFTQRIMTTDDIGQYDYGSIMHYRAFSFSRNYQPTIETIPPGMLIGQREVLSTGDIDGVSRLYGKTPTKTIISTTPPGLQIEVDGIMLTGPQSFDWSPGTSHTIRAPSPQGGDSERFLFGKWSDGGEQTHTVMASSSITAFTAHFIQHFKIETGVSQPGSGTVTISPSSSDGFYTARTPVEATANPAGGFSFQGWTGQFYSGLHGFSGNPARFWVRWSQLNYTAVMANTGVQNFVQTTVATNFPGRRAVVDSVRQRLPTNFGWFIGSTHTIGVEDAVQVGPSGVSRWVFKEWSDGGAATHNVTASEEASTLTADFTKQYLLTTLAGFGGSIEVGPSSGDGFYDEGTLVQLTALPDTGFELSSWFGDVLGTDNTQFLVMDDQGWVGASFAVVGPTPSGPSPGGIVNAASFNAFAAPASIMSLFGVGFADRTEVATTTPLPTTLAGTTVTVTDSAGVSRPAELFFVSERQINFVIPEGTALGPITVTVTREDGSSGTITMQVEAVGPALFSANADGQGAPAALYLRFRGAEQTAQDFTFDPGTPLGAREPVLIDFGAEDELVFVAIFGTGMRGGAVVTATIDGENVSVSPVVALEQFVGLDQANVGPISRDFIGRGVVELRIWVDGIPTNVVLLLL